MAVTSPAMQQSGLLTEAAQMVPMLAKRLADSLEAAGLDPRDIFKQTGWLRDTDGTWVYNQGAGELKLRDPSETPRLTPASYSKPAEVEQAPRRFLTDDDPAGIQGIASGNRWPSYRTRGGSIKEVIDPLDRTAFRPPKADELFDAPFMFEGTPNLRNIDVNMQYEPDAYRYGGGFIPQRYMDPGQGPMVDITAPKPGSAAPEGHDVLSVARHEIGGHGIQDYYARPMGGNWQMPEMDILGMEVAKRAREGEQRLHDTTTDIMNRRMETMGFDEATRDLRRVAFSDWRPQYGPFTDINNYSGYASGVKPAYSESSWPFLGYKGLHGEAMARNEQTRGALPQGLPMTGERGGYRTQGGGWKDVEGYNQPGPREGDLHPFETLDMPPDLLFMRPSGENVLESPFSGGGQFPPQGAFDWLFFPRGVTKDRG